MYSIPNLGFLNFAIDITYYLLLALSPCWKHLQGLSHFKRHLINWDAWSTHKLMGSLITKDLPISENLWWRDLIFGGDNLFKDLFMCLHNSLEAKLKNQVGIFGWKVVLSICHVGVTPGAKLWWQWWYSADWLFHTELQVSKLLLNFKIKWGKCPLFFFIFNQLFMLLQVM